ncbi:unnamed protein product [Rhizopus microsporus]
MSDLRDLHTPTFRRGEVIRSTIDYLFLSTILSANYIDATVDFVDPEWSDHAILSVELKLDLADSHGPGAWRANPVYLGHKGFRRHLANMLTEVYHSEIAHSQSSPQILWDMVKARVKEFTRKYGRSYVSWRSQKRHCILQSSLPEGVLVEHLPRVERQIASLQRDLVEIKVLKAEKTWREHGETDAGYIKKSASVRSAQRSILQLWDPSRDEFSSSRDDLLRISSDFYRHLFTAEPVSNESIGNMLAHIPTDCKLSSVAQDTLSCSIDVVFT